MKYSLATFAILCVTLICVSILSACRPQETPQTRTFETSEVREPQLVRQAASRFGLDLTSLPLAQPNIEFPYVVSPQGYRSSFEHQDRGRKVFVVGANLVPFFGDFEQLLYDPITQTLNSAYMVQQMDSQMRALGAIKLNSSPIPTQKYNDLDQNFSSQIIEGEVHTYGFRLSEDDAVLIQIAIGTQIEYLVMQVDIQSPNGQGQVELK